MKIEGLTLTATGKVGETTITVTRTRYGTPPVASLLQDGSPPVEAPLGFAREPPPARQIAGLHENCAERQMAAAAPNESGEGPDEPPPPPRHRHEGGA